MQTQSAEDAQNSEGGAQDRARVVTDHPIERGVEDELGRLPFAQAIARTIQQYEDGGFNFAVSGKWGEGKSSVLNLVGELLASQDVKAIEFSPWKYSQEPLSVKRMFLRTLKRELDSPIDLSDLYSGVTVETERSLLSRLWVAGRYAVNWVIYTLLLITLFWLPLNMWYVRAPGSLWSVVDAISTALRLGPLPRDATLTGTVLVAAIVLGGLSTILPSARDFMASMKLETVNPQLRSAEQFESRFDDLLRTPKWLPLRKVSLLRTLALWGPWARTIQYRRFIILVDDLDRCRVDEVKNVLDGLMTFFEHDRCTYIVTADHEVIERQVARQLQESWQGQAPEDPKRAQELEQQLIEQGREYLRKIFQINWRIPPLAPAIAQKFIERQTAATGVDRVLDATGLGRLHALISRYYGDNPRKMKNFVRKLRFYIDCLEAEKTDHLAKADHSELPEHERHIAANAARQVDEVACCIGLLAKLLVMQDEFRDFYSSVARNPELLSELELHLAGKESGLAPNRIEELIGSEQTITEEQTRLRRLIQTPPMFHDEENPEILAHRPSLFVHVAGNTGFEEPLGLDPRFVSRYALAGDWQRLREEMESSEEGARGPQAREILGVIDRGIGEDQHATIVKVFTAIVDLPPYADRHVMIRELIQKVKTWERPAHEIITADGIAAVIGAMEGDAEGLEVVVEVVRSLVFPSEPEFRDAVLRRLDVTDIEARAETGPRRVALMLVYAIKDEIDQLEATVADAQENEIEIAAYGVVDLVRDSQDIGESTRLSRTSLAILKRVDDEKKRGDIARHWLDVLGSKPAVTHQLSAEDYGEVLSLLPHDAEGIGLAENLLNVQPYTDAPARDSIHEAFLNRQKDLSMEFYSAYCNRLVVLLRGETVDQDFAADKVSRLAFREEHPEAQRGVIDRAVECFAERAFPSIQPMWEILRKAARFLDSGQRARVQQRWKDIVASGAPNALIFFLHSLDETAYELLREDIEGLLSSVARHVKTLTPEDLNSVLDGLREKHRLVPEATRKVLIDQLQEMVDSSGEDLRALGNSGWARLPVLLPTHYRYHDRFFNVLSSLPGPTRREMLQLTHADLEQLRGNATFMTRLVRFVKEHTYVPHMPGVQQEARHVMREGGIAGVREFLLFSDDFSQKPDGRGWHRNYRPTEPPGSDLCRIEDSGLRLAGTPQQLPEGENGACIDLPDVQKGKSYDIRCRVRSQRQSAIPFQLWIHDTTGEAEVRLPRRPTKPKVKGGSISATFTGTGSGALRVHLHHLAGQGAVWVDRVEVRELI